MMEPSLLTWPPHVVIPPAATTADLAAFLRGLEQRAVVFAQLQAGSASRGDLAYASALRPFRNAALQADRAQWPVLFWKTLLADPRLRDPEADDATWDADVASLGELPGGLRAALLLRLAGALGEVDAANALGISRSDYRQALQQALPHHPDGDVDTQALRSLVDGVTASAHALTPERRAHLARVRQAGAQGRHAEWIGPWSDDTMPDVAIARPRWLHPALAAVALACVLALLATVYWPFGRWNADGTPRISSQPLDDSAPAARYEAASYLLTHPDFELLVQTADAPVVEDLAFYAWYAAERAQPTRQQDVLPQLTATPVGTVSETSVDDDAL